MSVQWPIKLNGLYSDANPLDWNITTRLAKGGKISVVEHDDNLIALRQGLNSLKNEIDAAQIIYISDDHFFADNTERDAFFSGLDITIGTFISVGAGYQLWNGAAWIDKSAMVQGPAGPAGLAPHHEWSGADLRFRNPDGSWGPWVAIDNEVATQLAVLVVDSQAARDKAQDWAEKAEDVEVEIGFYSAKHHALKAALSATTASTAKDDAETARDLAQGYATAAADNSRLTVGTVTTGAAGTSASATITGDPGEQVLDMTIPQGEQGSAGATDYTALTNVPATFTPTDHDNTAHSTDYEPDLGNPDVDGKVLSSLVNGTRSWISVTVDVSGKADKVTSPTNGNLAGLDATGNLTDSGSKSADFATTVHTHLIADLPVATSGTSSSTQIVRADDARLSDARTPTAHTHGNITNTGLVGTTANLPLITGTGGIVQASSFGTAANTFCQGNDARLSDARPASDVYAWAKADTKPAYTNTEVGAAPTSHTHGNVTNDGKIGTTAALPIITGTGGVLQAGSFGTEAGTFCQGNDERLNTTASLSSSATQPNPPTSFWFNTDIQSLYVYSNDIYVPSMLVIDGAKENAYNVVMGLQSNQDAWLNDWLGITANLSGYSQMLLDAAMMTDVATTAGSMGAISNSSIACENLATSAIATDKVVASATAMGAISTSSIAAESFTTSATAMNDVFDSVVAKRAVFDSVDWEVAIRGSTVAMTVAYDKSTLVSENIARNSYDSPAPVNSSGKWFVVMFTNLYSTLTYTRNARYFRHWPTSLSGTWSNFSTSVMGVSAPFNVNPAHPDQETMSSFYSGVSGRFYTKVQIRTNSDTSVQSTMALRYIDMDN